ncbi:glycoside hydrolase family 32 protein [Paenibacillus silviterrae]|uniref:glycoside hydrolase family 32 protein n=1 Tax=Paenibacillus silviterrae TaxID=3242194 RepID=UPI0025438232|nr:glycoside hydrolase family 32 protein [Paenibacillus chinjuensis]
MDYTKERADRFIQENKHLLRSDYRLNYHLLSEFGWMNDPNGFVQYKGTYHLFYQHYPYEPRWGPMHWGHAVSRDLIKWEYLPVALAPDTDFDKDGCFSGSAIEKDGKLILMYTGHVVTGPDKDNHYAQSQGIAVSEDGVRFVKSERNPVIGADQIPSGSSKKDFRDPKLFEKDGSYYVVLGSNDGEGNGQVLLYLSADLLTWEFVSVMAKSGGDLGDNWECPDLFSLGERDVLIMSPQRVPAQGDSFRNLHSTSYMVGLLDIGTGKFSYDEYHPIDHGFDFYAPQTTLDDKGRRIMIGWMDMWESDMPTQQGHYWAGAMSLPREVVRDGDRLKFQPVEEIAAYRTNLYEASNVMLDGERDLEASGDSYELQVVIDARDAEEFGLKLRTGAGEETVVAYRAGDRTLRLNRDLSGIGPKGERCTKVELRGGKLALRIFVDMSSVEVFVQDGEQVMTARIYPGPESLGIKAFSTGECVLESFRKWDIR